MVSADFWNKYKNGQTMLGTHITCNDPQQTELIANVGFDYFWIDTEHTVIERYNLLMHLIAAKAGGVPAFVRIPWNDLVLAKPILDIGVDGIVFPMINTGEDALNAVKYCLYPPEGMRGFGPRRAIRFGLDSVADYISSNSKEIIKLIQIETKKAVENIDDIANTPGVDILVLGPCDLSGAFGKLNQLLDPEIQKVYNYVVKRAHAAGKPVLVSNGNYSEEYIKMWLEMGIDMITVGSEVSYIMNGAKTVKKNFEQVISTQNKD